MAIKKGLISEIKHYANNLSKGSVQFKKLVLFGSYAKETNKSWSDIDLCVVSNSFGKDRHSERLMLINFKDDKTLNIEPHPYNPKDLANKWDPLAQEILKYGISVS